MESKLKILIIDNDESFLHDVYDRLSHKYNIFLEPSPYRGIEASSDIRPDIVLVSMELGDLTITEFLQRWLYRIELQDIPIVVIGNSHEKYIQADIKKMGVVGFMKKNSDYTTLSRDLTAIYDSLSHHLSSATKKLAAFTAFNAKIKDNNLREQLIAHKEQQKVLISFADGEKLVEKFPENECGPIVYLNIKQELIPLVTEGRDFEEVIEDMGTVVPVPTNECYLYFDLPESFFGADGFVSNQEIGEKLLLSLANGFKRVISFSLSTRYGGQAEFYEELFKFEDTIAA